MLPFTMVDCFRKLNSPTGPMITTAELYLLAPNLITFQVEHQIKLVHLSEPNTSAPFIKIDWLEFDNAHRCRLFNSGSLMIKFRC